MINNTPLCVLVIEDDPDTQANIRDILELDGHRCIAALTLAGALRRENWGEIQVILLDRRLPDGNAEDALPRLRELAPYVPVVVVTGYPDVEGVIGALREGAHDYLLKPINPEALRASLRRIAELHESEQRFRVLFEKSLDAMLVADDDGCFRMVNSAACQLLGYPPEQLLTMQVGDLPGEGSEELRHFQDYVSQGKERGNFEFFRPDGEKRIAEYAAVEIAPGYHLSILRDVTERLRLEQEVCKAVEEEKTRIGRDLHDGVGSQLSGIGLIVGALNRKLRVGEPVDASETEIISKYLGEAMIQVRQLSHELCSVEDGPGSLEEGLGNLAHKIHLASALCCRFVGPEEAPSTLDRTTANHLYRIAQEAVHNAIKYSSAKHLTIQFGKKKSGTLDLAIEDDGKGFDITEASCRDGIGLHTMQYRARAIGGDLTIESAPGKGTRIRCRAPVSYEEGCKTPRCTC